jgi:hypothetical protein
MKDKELKSLNVEEIRFRFSESELKFFTEALANHIGYILDKFKKIIIRSYLLEKFDNSIRVSVIRHFDKEEKRLKYERLFHIKETEYKHSVRIVSEKLIEFFLNKAKKEREDNLIEHLKTWYSIQSKEIKIDFLDFFQITNILELKTVGTNKNDIE